MPLKINLDALGPDEEEPFSSEGVRVGSLLVSPQGLTAPVGGPSFVLSPADLTMVPEKDGGFLGKGSSGAVWRAVHQPTGKHVAVKEIKVSSQAHVREIRRELETLYDSSAQASPHMVDFYGAYTHEGSVFIAVECMDGTLADLPKPMPLTVLAHVTHSVLRGLVYLHRQRHLIHRDLKPSNVLFSRATGDVKISDFGVSSILECTKADANSFVGTVTYMSPERLKGDVYSFAADIWSLGLVVAELALGARPYPDLRNSDNVEARFWSLLQHLSGEQPALQLPPDMNPQLADFIMRCVAKSPEDRPSCTALLEHPFISSRCCCGGGNTSNDSTENNSDVDQRDRDAVRQWLEEIDANERRRERKARRRRQLQQQQQLLTGAPSETEESGASEAAAFLHSSGSYNNTNSNRKVAASNTVGDDCDDANTASTTAAAAVGAVPATAAAACAHPQTVDQTLGDVLASSRNNSSISGSTAAGRRRGEQAEEEATLEGGEDGFALCAGHALHHHHGSYHHYHRHGGDPLARQLGSGHSTDSSNSPEDSTTATEHPVRCPRQPDPEPPVNLDEELDKLLL